MTRVLLMNPNTNSRTTSIMCRIAARVLDPPPVGWTAPRGPGLITSPEALANAAHEVAAAEIPAATRAVIVAAFGDPGADLLAARVSCPVIGIGGAAARAASRAGTFAVATTTPDLAPLIDELMQRHAGHGGYLGCFCSTGDAAALMADPAALDAALLDRIRDAQAAGAAGVIIGGGPLGEAAERIRGQSPVTLFNPVLCAAREAAH